MPSNHYRYHENWSREQAARRKPVALWLVVGVLAALLLFRVVLPMWAEDSRNWERIEAPAIDLRVER